MSFLDCPYCQKKVDIHDGNQFWLFSTRKRCQLCFNPIKINEIGFFAYFSIPIVAFLISHFPLIAIKQILEVNQYVEGIILICLTIFLSVKIGNFVSNKFGIKLFYKKIQITQKE